MNLKIIKLLLLLHLCLLLFHSCTQEHEFEQFIESTETQYKIQFQVADTLLLNIISPEELQADLAFCQQQLETLNTFSSDDLSPENQKVQQKWKEQLEKKQKQIVVYQQEPNRYNIAKSIQKIMQDTSLKVGKQLVIIQQQLKQTPAYYEMAKANLQKPEGEYAQKAVYEHTSTFVLLSNLLPRLLQQSDWKTRQQQVFKETLETATLAVKDYIAFCRSISLNQSKQPQ